MKTIIIFILMVAGVLFNHVRSQTGFNFPLGFTDTTSSAADTLSRHAVSAASNSMADTCKQYQIIWITDDTIEVSSSASFPSNCTNIILPVSDIGGIVQWTWWSIQTPNWYYKCYGTGTPRVYPQIKCWDKQ